MSSGSAVSGRAGICLQKRVLTRGAESSHPHTAPCPARQLQAAPHVSWKPVRGPRPLAVALDPAELDSHGNSQRAAEALEQLHGCRSLTDAAGLVVKAMRAGLSWSDAVEALVHGAAEGVATQSRGTPAPLHVAHPSAVLVCGEPAPVIVVLHQLFGLRQRDANICAALARAGCVAVAPDLHALLPRAPLERLSALGRLDPSSTASTINDVLVWIDEQPWGSQRPSLSVLGLGSFGGSAALHFGSQAGGAVDAVITVDGAVIKEVGSLVCPVLGLFTEAQEHAAGRALQTTLQLSSVPVTLTLLDHEHSRSEDKQASIVAECLRFLERHEVVGPPTVGCSTKWGL